MKLYTSQMGNGKWIPEKLGIPVLDVTVKSGDKTFSPLWGFLNEYKSSDWGKEAQERYTKKFITQMRLTFIENNARWREVLEMDSVCIMCYCPKNRFCHRLILIGLFEKQCKRWGIPFSYEGEITKEGIINKAA